MFDQGAGRHGAGADDVAGGQGHPARGVGDDFAEAPVHRRGRPGADHGVVDQRGDAEAEFAAAAVGLQLVGGDQVGAQRDAAVLALGLPDAQLAVQLLQIARRPVVEDGVADDRRLGLGDRQVLTGYPDHRRDLQFEVLPGAARRHRRVVVGSQHGGRAGEVERRHPIPGVLEHPAPAHRGLAVAHVLQKAQRVPDRRRARDRRHQRHLGQPRRGRCPQRLLAGAAQPGGATPNQLQQRDTGRQRVDRLPGQHPGAFTRTVPIGHPAHALPPVIRGPPGPVSCPAAVLANWVGVAGRPMSIRCNAPRRPGSAGQT
ncbi:hypothetical protein C1Y40_00811 [Mycobacterium talmoniae]|uniref:Uncharacterized protein n=1 Tax=Mycobacterium talmoniae TaxID=1858794 RepID=A0A2S8BQM0_9MYCO|nr:hypothetical protein C1Y40_00811 [Mycobacterium talmoniae]